ncbi:short-chain dehydrogenase/reductase SDR [Trametopsis cervina]|nr:short-chain dehydrogenase/reductase SDR [Trametopsis cervina]
MASKARPVFIVAGIGSGSGTGGAAARAFAKAGFRVAILTRSSTHASALASSITASGGEAAGFELADYGYESVADGWARAASHNWGSPEKSEVRAALYNAGGGVFKTFLDVTPADVQKSLEGSVAGAFAFSRAAILAFKANEVDGRGKRGTLIFTGATASVRGNVWTSAFAAGKFGLRALSQSLAKEFGREDIHVAHAIIDGAILTGERAEKEKDQQEAGPRLDPDSIANAYVYLEQQDKTAWTWELDLRPSHEKW